MSTPPAHRCSPPPLRLLLIERHALFRQALAVLCERLAPVRVLAHLPSVPGRSQVVSAADAVILHLDAQGEPSSDQLRRLRRLNPTSLILALVPAQHLAALARAREPGVVEVVSTEVGLADLMHAVQTLGTSLVQLEHGWARPEVCP